ncbi:MAG: ATP-binding protein [Ktedonobacteraceae bacterium]
MKIPDRTSQEPSPSEATATLIDLAKLARRAGTVSEDALDDLGHELLQRLVVACQAQRGAVLLVMMDDVLAGQSGQLPEQVKDLRILAIHDVRAEELHPLLATLAVQDSEQAVVDGSRWVTFTLPLAADLEGQPLQILLLLGWRGLGLDAFVAWGQQMLPLLADAIASVIVTMVQAEQLHELERTLTKASLATMDLFKAEVLATVSHELRSPLASIKGYAATLLRHERRLPREERRQFLLAINEGTERLERIVDRLLEMSQLETGAMTLTLASLNMILVAHEAMRVAEEGLPAQLAGRFTFRLVVEDGHGKPAERVPLVEADPRRLREVLDNLLENAINYSPEGGAITVAVRPVSVPWPLTRASDSQDQHIGKHEERGKLRLMLEIVVCDTGIGIAPEYIERIFERFYRVDLRLTREVNGLGLGLAMCKRIVELHSGAIWAESPPEGGSTFRVLLPLERAETTQ